MSTENTRVSVILGICQQDPERWREFDAIYRPILFGFLRKQGLNDVDANDVVQDIFVKLLGKIHTYDRNAITVPRPGSSAWRTTRWSTTPGGGPRYAKALDGWAAEMLHPIPVG